MSVAPDDHRRAGGPATGVPPLGFVARCVAAVVVMAPWPLLGILATRSAFDEAAEAFLLFGGFTLFPLMILALFGVPDGVYLALVMIVWVAAAVGPAVWPGRRLRTKRAVGLLLGVQALFSLAQALMGALLIVGKSV